MCPWGVNLIPSRKEASLYRRKSDERVELFGAPCSLHRQAEITFDAFDNQQVVTGSVKVVSTRVILEYQKPLPTVAERARDIKDFPFVAIFRFKDDVKRGDIFDVAYVYARAAGLLNYCHYTGAEAGPSVTTTMRFKIVNRITSGVNADLTNRYNVVPTEESSWT
jgi:hypothetical protein